MYGAITNDGSGNFPPAATYQYLNVFTSGLDYTYDADLLEIVESPVRNLAGQSVQISFNYEDNLIPNIDYVPQIHTEILDERIANRINNSGSLNVLNSPITSVFRIYNETSGEIYQVQRWNDTTVFFTFHTPPKVISVLRERAVFTNVVSETLIVNTILTNTSNSTIYKIFLQNNQIMSASEDVIGTSFNSSVSFSRNDIFTQELYFDDQVLTLQQNLNKLISIGYYVIDYKNGIIYLNISNSQTYDIGSMNYIKIYNNNTKSTYYFGECYL